MAESLNEAQAREVEHMAELATRRYFDRYLKDVWPIQQKALRDYANVQVGTHDSSPNAHGGVEQKFKRGVWILAGVAVASGASGATWGPRMLALLGL